MHQIVRREICFGLIPKTLKREYSLLNLIKTTFPASEFQNHFLTNAFNILVNGGFLRDQGILSIESVQTFYKFLGQEPEEASLRVANVLDFCNQLGFHELDYHPVVTLSNTSSTNGQTQGHAVVLSFYHRHEDSLVMTTIDSASESGQRFIKCPIVVEHGRQKLKIKGAEDEWCLGSQICYVLYLN